MPLLRVTLRAGEVLFMGAGLLLLGFCIVQVVHSEVRRSGDLEAVELAWSGEQPDTSLWSPSRIDAWQQSQVNAPDDVLAILEMPEVGLKVPVYSGASDLNMDLGAGHIGGTALPEEGSNVGIAGHRDGYFRVLKDAEVGDSLELRTSSGTQRYRIDEILIVDPLDVEVLDPTDESMLTLVTCYPFYFVGRAPQRYIVRARLDHSQAKL